MSTELACTWFQSTYPEFYLNCTTNCCSAFCKDKITGNLTYLFTSQFCVENDYKWEAEYLAAYCICNKWDSVVMCANINSVVTSTFAGIGYEFTCDTNNKSFLNPKYITTQSYQSNTSTNIVQTQTKVNNVYRLNLNINAIFFIITITLFLLVI